MRKLLLAALLAALVLPASAHAAFPGANGKIVFSDKRDDPNPSGCHPNCNWEIYSINADGTGVTRLTNSPEYDALPAWSPDGQKIVFNRLTPVPDIIVMNADGTGQTSLGFGFEPAWSPDGSKIVFINSGGCVDHTGGVFTMNSDGTGRSFLACDRAAPGDYTEEGPAWSPDGGLIAFTADLEKYDIFTVHSDGTNLTDLGNDPNDTDRDPNWSPDGSRIAWGFGLFSVQDIWAMNRDGTNKTNLTNDAPADYEPAYSPDGTKLVFNSDRSPVGLYIMSATGGAKTFLTTGLSADWQPIPINYPRPRGASPMRISLVPANEQCTAPNRAHGAPLAFPSCDPPKLTSTYLTVGTPDSNGKRTTMEAYILLKTVNGNPSTPADEADVKITADINNVFNKDLTDYTGSLWARVPLQVTDRDNTPNPGGPGPGTMFEIPFPFYIPCTADPDPQVGSDCTVATSVDALYPGTIEEGARSVWQIGQALVYDGGADGDPVTADNTLFATQGIFIP